MNFIKIREFGYFIIFLIILDLLFNLLFFTINKKFVEKDLYSSIRLNILNEKSIDENIKSTVFSEVIHPYLGYVVNPSVKKHNNYGFNTIELQDLKKEPFDIFIAVLGGSFASQFADISGNTLIEELKKSQKFENKKLKIINLALGGYKQPQQLFVLNYFLSIGITFDMVINIDGFNEIGLPLVENIPKNTNPFFPRSWAQRVGIINDSNIFNYYSSLGNWRKLRSIFAKIFQIYPLRLSAFFNTLWNKIDEYIDNKIYYKEYSLVNYRINNTKKLSWLTTGPNFPSNDINDVLNKIAKHWYKCSEMIFSLCIYNDIKYFHFLQPNVALQGFKELSENEKKYVNYQEGYHKHIEKGYNQLKIASEQLTIKKIPFYDCTKVFKDNKNQLYIDSCHLNKDGYDIFAKYIVNKILTLDSDY